MGGKWKLGFKTVMDTEGNVSFKKKKKKVLSLLLKDCIQRAGKD